MKRIALIGATGIDWWKDVKKKSFVEMHTPDGYEIHNFVPRHGTYSVESLVDEAYNAPFILEQVVKAGKERYDAVVIDCACDPVLEAAREISAVPVVGSRNAAFHVALTLGTRFGVVTVQGASLKRCIEHGIRKDGLISFCSGIKYLSMPVLDISKNQRIVQRELREMCKALITENNADVIILGCTGLSHEVDVKPISEELGVPIIDPFVVAIRFAQLLIESNLSHSKIAYPYPPRKRINEAPSLKGAFDDILKE